MTLVDVLEKNAREIPDKAAIIFHNIKINYQELNETVNRLAAGLVNIGIKKGGRVGLMLPRIPELIIGFLGIAKSQGIAVPINFELTAENIHAILDSISPQCVIVHSQFQDIAGRSVPRDSQIPVIIVGDCVEKGLSWNDVLKNGSPHNPCPDIKKDDVMYLNYTSGSTGNAKGAITTYANIYWNTLASIDALGLKGDDVHLCMFAPYAHPHEIFARPVYLGGTMVLVDKIYPKSIAEAISHHKVTCMMGLAPIYENLLEVIEHNTYDIGSLRIPESGGMHTRTELIERFIQKLGIPIIPVWGSTETTGIAIANRPGKQILQGSVGRPCTTYGVKIVDDDDKELPEGKIGEMIFNGPAVVQGYYDLTKDQDCFKDGWYYSGDLGKMDEGGNVYFVDRKSGMMKVAGLKVYPQEIERVLTDHPDVKDAVVISVKDRLRGEIPKSIIVPKNGKQLTERDILSFCRKRLSHYKLPRIIEIRESLPRTGSGKINRKILQMEHT